MSDLLSIGASGVRAYQGALTTVSDNIANASSTGYTRRATTLGEIASSNARSRLASDGNGVVVTGINRLGDNFRAAAVRTAGADLARTETSITWLDKIQGALTANQLGDRLTGFFNAAKTVAADPTASTPRAALLEAGTSVAGAFAATGNALDQINVDLDSTAEAAVSSLETLGQALAKINDGLGRAQGGSVAAAQLLDQRDQILEQLSAISDLSVSTDGLGRVSVRLGGATGPVLVADGKASDVTYVRSPAGAVSFAVFRDGAATALTPSAGALAGVVEGAQRIADALAELDRIAIGFTDGINAVQAQGRDLDGNAGAPIFAVGATPTDISLALTNPRGIAAAAVGGGPRDNRNLAALEALRGTGGFEADSTALVATNAATLAARKTVSEAQTSIHNGAVASRDAVSGVNLDSEAVDLLRFQQAYQASSRVIQVARETLQSILDIR